MGGQDGVFVSSFPLFCLSVCLGGGSRSLGRISEHVFRNGRLRGERSIWESFRRDVLLITPLNISFAATGLVAVIIAWFLLPEVARRTPAEIDEM